MIHIFVSNKIENIFFKVIYNGFVFFFIAKLFLFFLKKKNNL